MKFRRFLYALVCALLGLTPYWAVAQPVPPAPPAYRFTKLNIPSGYRVAGFLGNKIKLNSDNVNGSMALLDPRSGSVEEITDPHGPVLFQTLPDDKKQVSKIGVTADSQRIPYRRSSLGGIFTAPESSTISSVAEEKGWVLLTTSGQGAQVWDGRFTYSALRAQSRYRIYPNDISPNGQFVIGSILPPAGKGPSPWATYVVWRLEKTEYGNEYVTVNLKVPSDWLHHYLARVNNQAEVAVQVVDTEGSPQVWLFNARTYTLVGGSGWGICQAIGSQGQIVGYSLHERDAESLAATIWRVQNGQLKPTILEDQVESKTDGTRWVFVDAPYISAAGSIIVALANDGGYGLLTPTV